MSPNPRRRRELARLRQGIARLSKARPKRHRLSLTGQPFDDWLLRSPLFRRSRELYLDSGGILVPALLSTPRSLSSAALLHSRIEYSPTEAELFWAALDPREWRDPDHLQRLRTYTSSLFHEQNHRLLWGLLPPAPREAAGLRRYLNLAESLVIAADMALGDELTPAVAETFYLAGAIYDPGTKVRRETRPSKRVYRNYLQASAHATYLTLEGYEPGDLPLALAALFPSLGPLARRAATRAGQLDTLFIASTNRRWQKMHYKEARRVLARARPALELPADPMDHREAYLFGERWFEFLGL